MSDSKGMYALDISDSSSWKNTSIVDLSTKKIANMSMPSGGIVSVTLSNDNSKLFVNMEQSGFYVINI